MTVLQRHEAERLKRIHTRQEDCRRVDRYASKLLQQDAKKHHLEGTEKIEEMSKQEIGKTTRQLMNSMKNINGDIQTSLDINNEISNL